MATRRRAISIIAGCLVAPSLAFAGQDWRCRAMGTEVRIILSSPPRRSTFSLFSGIEQIIARVERCFSLHVDSELTRLNRTGMLRHPSQAMRDILKLSGRINQVTGGAFDPTIQPLWLALARGEDGTRERRLLGWEKVSDTPEGITLASGVQLTLNGIAQGFCADLVADYLRRQGFDHVLVDTGELLALGPQADGSDWSVTIAGPDDKAIGRTNLANRAIATSSPFSLRLDHGEPHILGPRGQSPRWATVSISAPSAAVADALSTAACLMERSAIDRALGSFPGVRLEAIA
jgi:thiamine biosynthesis lipoprotein